MFNASYVTHKTQILSPHVRYIEFYNYLVAQSTFRVSVLGSELKCLHYENS